MLASSSSTSATCTTTRAPAVSTCSADVATAALEEAAASATVCCAAADAAACRAQDRGHVCFSVMSRQSRDRKPPVFSSRSGSGSSTSKRHGNYLSVQTATARGGGGGGGGAGDGNAPLQQETEMDEDWAAGRRTRGRYESEEDRPMPRETDRLTRGRYESEGGVLDRTDTGIETARVKLASAEVRIVRAANYARVVEDALRRTPGNAELEEELGRSRDELAASRREKDELEAEQRLAEALYRRAFYAKEQREDRRERAAPPPGDSLDEAGPGRHWRTGHCRTGASGPRSAGSLAGSTPPRTSSTSLSGGTAV